MLIKSVFHADYPDQSDFYQSFNLWERVKGVFEVNSRILNDSKELAAK